MKYTKSAIIDTIDFIKRIIYVVDLIVQLCYIGYMIYRIISKTGFIITNIILLALSFGYFIYHIATTREFYTLDEIESRNNVKIVVKISKRVVNSAVTCLSIYQLIVITDISNMKILTTLMMILGFILSLIGDFIIKLINSKAMLIINSIKYDLNEIKDAHPVVAGKPIDFIDKKMGFDINNIDPNMIKQMKDANYRQEMKARRQRDFNKKHNI